MAGPSGTKPNQMSTVVVTCRTQSVSSRLKPKDVNVTIGCKLKLKSKFKAKCLKSLMFPKKDSKFEILFV